MSVENFVIKNYLECMKFSIENQIYFEINYEQTKELYNAIHKLLKENENQRKEIEEFKKENKEIRDWKYIIDNPIDLDKLKELDIIKIKGKEYISKSTYNELEKDKKALVSNYSKVLGEFIPKDKIKATIKELEEQKEKMKYDGNRCFADYEQFCKNLQFFKEQIEELLEEN